MLRTVLVSLFFRFLTFSLAFYLNFIISDHKIQQVILLTTPLYTQRTEYSLIFFVRFSFYFTKIQKKERQLNKIDETEQKIIQNQQDSMLHEEKRKFFQKELNGIFEIRQKPISMFYVDDDNGHNNEWRRGRIKLNENS